jgi:hypothetical protein
MQNSPHSYLSPVVGDCVAIATVLLAVILNEVKDLVLSTVYQYAILRLTPQNDIMTRSLEDKGEGA